MTKPRPKTGERRETNQPLKIDRLSASVHEAILTLRNADGKTWQEIEAQSSAPYSKEWKYDGGGFVDWNEVPVAVLELFPDMRLPHSSLHRWYDLRVAQVSRDTLARAKQAQELATAFIAADLVNDDQGVINAARDTLMGVLAEDGTTKGRRGAALGLIKLGDLMQKARANAIKERKVTVDEQTLQVRLEQIKKKAAAVIQTVEGEASGTAKPMSREDVLKAVREIYGVA